VTLVLRPLDRQPATTQHGGTAAVTRQHRSRQADGEEQERGSREPQQQRVLCSETFCVLDHPDERVRHKPTREAEHQR
jgi:hypothetical protein